MMSGLPGPGNEESGHGYCGLVACPATVGLVPAKITSAVDTNP
jgi:hypothetical protein